MKKFNLLQASILGLSILNSTIPEILCEVSPSIEQFLSGDSIFDLRVALGKRNHKEASLQFYGGFCGGSPNLLFKLKDLATDTRFEIDIRLDEHLISELQALGLIKCGSSEKAKIAGPFTAQLA